MDDTLLMLLSGKNQIEAIRKTNDYTQRFGLSLSEEDVQELMVSHIDCLKEEQRIEFGGGVTDKLIFAFCDSDYIYQENYVEVIQRLQQIFYLYKNESMDELTDDELIDLMRNAFDGECQGSLDYLEQTYLEKFAREVRANTRKYIGRYPRKHEEI